MSDMADVLVAHFYHSAEFAGIGGRWSIECNCDYIVTADSHPEVEAAFAAHQAAALSAAGFGPVQEAQAEAWDEGHESGFWNGRESAGHHEMRYVGLEHAKLNNPYRKVSDDGS